MSKLYKWCCQYLNLIILNGLWLVGFLLGLGFLGLMPASVASSQVYQMYNQEMNEILPIQTVTKIFFIRYKREFISSNCMVVYFYLLAAFLYVDYRLLGHASDKFSVAVGILLILIIYFTTLVLLVLPTVYTKFQLKAYRYTVQSYLLLACSPLVVIKLTAMLVVMYLIFNVMPLLLLPIYVSVQIKLVNDIMLQKFAELSIFYKQPDNKKATI